MYAYRVDGKENQNRKEKIVRHQDWHFTSTQIKEMKQQGLIELSGSPYNSHVVLFPKQDGQLQFCVNYKALNDITYPIPPPDINLAHTLRDIGEAQILSTLDPQLGFWQKAAHLDSRRYTAFTSPEGETLEICVMPFRLKNAPWHPQHSRYACVRSLSVADTRLLACRSSVYSKQSFELLPPLSYIAVFSSTCSQGSTPRSAPYSASNPGVTSCRDRHLEYLVHISGGSTDSQHDREWLGGREAYRVTKHNTVLKSAFSIFLLYIDNSIKSTDFSPGHSLHKQLVPRPAPLQFTSLLPHGDEYPLQLAFKEEPAASSEQHTDTRSVPYGHQRLELAPRIALPHRSLHGTEEGNFFGSGETSDLRTLTSPILNGHPYLAPRWEERFPARVDYSHRTPRDAEGVMLWCRRDLPHWYNMCSSCNQHFAARVFHTSSGEVKRKMAPREERILNKKFLMLVMAQHVWGGLACALPLDDELFQDGGCRGVTPIVHYMVGKTVAGSERPDMASASLSAEIATAHHGYGSLVPKHQLPARHNKAHIVYPVGPRCRCGGITDAVAVELSPRNLGVLRADYPDTFPRRSLSSLPAVEASCFLNEGLLGQPNHSVVLQISMMLT
ncbi:hypothetical protein PR048_007655 [Dryococelus australis]|uniref:Uncharacterized protein n=1 Tax=Dryococelus australis TaxID=614101 RepID=A0ABQ9HUV1_9NEOP|nr:hypothetical protein PR048_007655 [Dryococelus australis]